VIDVAVGAATHVGRVRRTNQDHPVVSPVVFGVADGMGGHSAGEKASEIAMTALTEVEALDSIEALVDAVHGANDRIVEAAREDPSLRGMGTTVCLIAALDTAFGPRLGVANVGDSRAYLLTDDGLHQLTEDHSLVEALVRDGRLTREEAADHPQRNIVTRALGIDDKVLVDSWELAAQPGDRYLVCSDGLFNEVADDAIVAVLSTTEDPQAAADELIELANDGGGRDNTTVVVLDIVDAPGLDQPPHDRVLHQRLALPDATVRHDDERRLPAEIVDHDDPDPSQVRLEHDPPTSRLFTWRLAVFAVATLMVLGVLVVSVLVYARSSYFVGPADGTAEPTAVVPGDGSAPGDDETAIVIWQGRPGGVLWFEPTIEESAGIQLEDLTAADRDDVVAGVEFDSLDDARRYVDTLLERAAQSAP